MGVFAVARRCGLSPVDRRRSRAVRGSNETRKPTRAVNIEVRLFATLRKHLPAGSGRTGTVVVVPAGSTIADVIGALGIPIAAVFLVLVNGRYEADRQRQLDDDCTLSIWPPIAGG